MFGGWAGPGHLPPVPPDLTLDRIRYKPNTSGLAWWAGTSFATPAIAGMLAKSWSTTGPRNGTPLNFATAKDELDQQVIQTVAGEQVIHVNQG